MAAAAESILGSHETLVALRERMRGRGAACRTDDSTQDVIPVVTLEPARPPSALSPADMLADLKRAQSLRDRVLSRGHAEAGSGSDLWPGGPNKDIYAHEQQFPVDTVFELDRVETAARTRDPNRREVLLMAAESASVLKTLENQLGEEVARRMELERRVQMLQHDLGKSQEELDKARRGEDAAKLRHSELHAEVEKIKKDHASALDGVRKDKDAAIDSSRKEFETKARNDVSAAVEAQRKEAEARAAAQLELRTLEALVTEMREQLQSNGLALQNQTMTIRQLTEDLLAAKAQVTNLSVALNEKEKDLRALRADLHSAHSKSVKAAESEKELTALKVEMDILKNEFARVKNIAETVPALTVERDKLASAASRLELEMNSKNTELSRLRSQVESVRQQADAAFLHSAQFQQQGQQQQQHMGNFGQGQHGSFEALRREIEDEERRSLEEQRRWRQRQNRC